jgi:hypothetical protein
VLEFDGHFGADARQTGAIRFAAPHGLFDHLVSTCRMVIFIASYVT